MTPSPHPLPWLRVGAGVTALVTATFLGLLLAAGRARAEGEQDLRRSPIVRTVERCRSAVVSIHTTRVIRRNLYGWLELPPVEGKGIGSGTIFHPDGYVITNAHVIARASEVLVDVASDDGGTLTYPGRILAVDLANDLAILQLVAPGGEAMRERYPYLELSRSDDLMVGETVIALGNPFGIGLTVTTGVIGGLNRTLRPPPIDEGVPARLPGASRDEEPQSFDDFIQIDAAINPGNSGGPLFDVTGRWIGVNTAIWNRVRTAAEGIGFSIPVDRVRSLVGRAFKRRLIRGDWLGVEFEEGDGGSPRVRFAFPKGPALQSGLQEGDEITTVNGRPAQTLFDMRWTMSFLPHGAAVDLGVRRAGAALPGPLTVRLLPVPTTGLSDEHLGFQAEDVSDEENREAQLAFDAGVVVRRVRAGGPAARVGMQPGDVVIGLGTYRIRHSDDLLVFLQYVRPGDIVQVRVLRAVRSVGGRLVREEQAGQLVAE